MSRLVRILESVHGKAVSSNTSHNRSNLDDDRTHGDCRYVQSRRETGISSGRLVPTDDMDISPNSSPMSGGSSPVHHSYHSQSVASKRIRAGFGQVPGDLTAYGTAKPSVGNQYESGVPSSTTHLLYFFMPCTTYPT